MTSEFAVTVSKNDLLTVIRFNRDRHQTTFLRAIDAYHTLVVADLENTITAIKNGHEPDLVFRHARPDSHTKDYDAVISMLEMAKDDDIDISLSEYTRFAQDRWDWSDRWATVTSRYTEV